MIIFAAFTTFVTSFTAIYCASESKCRWFQLLIAGLVSFVIALLVSANLYY